MGISDTLYFPKFSFLPSAVSSAPLCLGGLYSVPLKAYRGDAENAELKIVFQQTLLESLG